MICTSSPENREKEVPVALPQTPGGQNSSFFIPVSAIRLTSVLSFFDALYAYYAIHLFELQYPQGGVDDACLLIFNGGCWWWKSGMGGRGRGEETGVGSGCFGA